MINVHIQTPYSLEKNLGKAYNQAMQLIPEGDAAVLCDGDISFLTPDYGHILTEYANRYPNAVLTCYTNRIHQLAKGQQSTCNSVNMKECLEFANELKNDKYEATALTGPVSGFLLVIHKHIWQKHKFNEDMKCLGVDNDFTNKVRAAGIKVLRMDSIIVYHVYRLLTGSKAHLL